MIKKYLVSLHLIFWLLLPFVFTFFRWAYQFTAFLPGAGHPAAPYLQLLEDTSVFNLAMVMIGSSGFYLIDLGLFPALTNQPKKKIKIIVYAFLLLLSPSLIISILSVFLFAVYWSYRYFLFSAYLVQLPFILLAIASGYLKRWINATKTIGLLEKQTIKTELELLKSQINPHFLFNTINNIDTLILKDPPLASQYLNELADLLRFMLYGVKTEKISLSKEIAYIEKYVQLQKIRSVNSNFVILTVNGTVGNQQIAPLLFIPLIENAFKHVPDKLTDGSIKIDFEISSSWILFTCRNKWKQTELKTAHDDGLGLNIISQRLTLLYKNRYQMEIKKDHDYYEVTLKLLFDAN
jgi:two-component system LytT family sensor kinase